MDNLLFLKHLQLKNFCTYKEYEFDFTKPDGTPYQYICLFGPNGGGKTSVLNAISMLTMNNSGRPEERVRSSLKQFVRNTDYNPVYERMLQKPVVTEPQMLIEGTYEMAGKEYVVSLTENGYTRNDFAPIAPPDADLDAALKIMHSGPWGSQHLQYRQRVAHMVSTDNDLGMNQFQIHASQIENFEKIVSQITRFPVEAVTPTGMTPQEKEFCTDFVLIKKDHRVHFKRMSAGEKKICKSFSILLNMMRSLAEPTKGDPAMPGWPRILLIDNIEMHVYYDRHVALVDSLKSVFNQQQIFATTHSGTLIKRYLDGENDRANELMIDLEKIN